VDWKFIATNVALILGLRKGELRGLRWVDLDRDTATLKITQQVQTANHTTSVATLKSAASRCTLPVPPGLLARLDQHQQQQALEPDHASMGWEDHGLIFASMVGTPIVPRNLNRHFYTVLAATQLTHIRVHDLRHTYATQLSGLGVSEVLIAAILGHSGSSVTRRYTCNSGIVTTTDRGARAVIESVVTHQ